MFVGELSLKRLELLRELVPHVGLIGVLINHKSLEADAQSKNMQAAANSIRQKIRIVNAGSEDEFDPAFARLSQSKVGALLIDNDPFYDSKRDKLVALAASYKIPTIYVWRDSVVAGGLVSYGASLVDSYRQVGAITPARSSRAPSPAIFRSSSRPSSNSSSTSRPPRPSASQSPSRSCSGPIR
jgi:ABC-type uncharacterized transport system substrate-binding protein